MHGPHKSGISEKSMIVREFYCYQGESGKIDNCKIGLSQSRNWKFLTHKMTDVVIWP